MKILHIFKTYFPETGGGLERVIRNICLYTTASGVENSVLTISGGIRRPDTIDSPEAWIIRYPLSLGPASTPVSLSLGRDFRKIIAGFDLLHYHFPWPYADLLELLINRGSKPSILTYHADPLKNPGKEKLYLPLARKFLQQVNLIAPTSRNYLQSSPVLGEFRNKCRVIPLGLDESSYPGVPRQVLKQWQERLGNDFFLFIGELREYKGLPFLLDAVKNSPHKLVIVGGGRMAGRLQARLREESLGNVTMTGRLEEVDKAALLQLARGVVLPSHLRSEAFGLALLEGAMYGKPLISTDLGTGTSLVNRHGITGLVVKPGDGGELRRALDRIAGNPEEAGRMGSRARTHFAENFTINSMGRQYLEVYRGVI